MAIAKSGNAKIDLLLDKHSWSGTVGKAVSINYTIDKVDWDFAAEKLDPNGVKIVGGPALLGAGIGLDWEMTSFKTAMQSWGNVAKITFKELLYNTTEVINIAARKVGDVSSNGKPDQALSTATYNSSGDGIKAYDILFDKDYIGKTPGTSGYETFVHELGHALFDFTDPNNGGANPTLNQSNSVMSYTTYQGQWAAGPMLYDIAAAQYLYGVNTTYHNTGTKYSADADSATNVHITGEAKLWTVWDAGGTDTFDFSKVAAASAGCTIDLRGGVDASGKVNFTKVGQEYIAIASDPATKWTSSIIIENAVGGSGKDIIYGNMGNNSLKGGLGNDLIVAGKGQDSVYGQDGNDTLSDSWWTGLDYTGLSNSKDTLLAIFH